MTGEGETMTDETREALARTIAEVTDQWDEPLDEVRDIPQIVNAILASGLIPEATTTQRDKGLTDYLAQMDQVGGVYTADFRDGFRHALAMLAAYESDEEPSPGRARPEVREAARLALTRRPCCPGAGSMAHVRGCVDHPEADRD